MISINESVLYAPSSTATENLNSSYNQYSNVILNKINLAKSNQIKNYFCYVKSMNSNTFNNIENKKYDSTSLKNNAKASILRTNNKISPFNSFNIFKIEPTIMSNTVFNLVSNADSSVPILNSSINKNFINNSSENCSVINNKQIIYNMATSNNENESLKFNELPFEQFYDVGEQLGRFYFLFKLKKNFFSGQFAFVRRVTKRATNEQFAAKFIRKRRYATSRRGVLRAHIQREVEVLWTIGGNENIIQLYEVFETPNEVILVLEL